MSEPKSLSLYGAIGASTWRNALIVDYGQGLKKRNILQLKDGIGGMFLERQMTEKQKSLIDQMNEFCREKLLYDSKTTCKAASEYIDRNIEEFKLQTMSDWQYQYL